ncbi:Protein phosphatase 2C C10F6.17c [Grifola frondosa]|uniref:Protein phosphatase 2C C10F6.17c n=1 Tax=Grifola frondosa TaxID=5627 RepID=A0A1C7MJQ4_GRIFR|nr:Protein phosphatase 2C C10F6.17c [Grifola frondosa]
MFRRAWKPILGTAILVGAPSYLYYKYSKSTVQTFELPVKTVGPDGKRTMATRAFPLLSKDDVEARLREHASFQSTTRHGGVVWKQATAHLAANDPIEDANASVIIERDTSDSTGPGDFLFFAVMDGHAGPYTSRVLAEVLIPTVAMELSAMINDPNSSVIDPSVTQKIKSLLWSSSGSSTPFDADPANVMRTIETAFTKLDAKIINAPLDILANAMDKESLQKKLIPDLSEHPMALMSMQTAMSGSCALLALLDTANRNLYVACTGDSRAVAGVYEDTEDGQGSWRVEVLTEDQTGRNPNELKRIQSEHPPDEAASVVSKGRILGGLEPSRAFGDARYKWPREVQEVQRSLDAFYSSEAQDSPYVTARPVVVHRDLSFLPLHDPSAPKPKSTLRFLVLATDGLWDELSSEEVVALVGGYFSGLKGTIPKDTLPNLVRTSSGAPTVEGKDKRRKQQRGAWAFVDDNVSTHLIRNAFGGADMDHMRKLLSIPAPVARSFRDDVTVTVVWWEDGREGKVKMTTVTPDENVKAKL